MTDRSKLNESTKTYFMTKTSPLFNTQFNSTIKYFVMIEKNTNGFK